MSTLPPKTRDSFNYSLFFFFFLREKEGGRGGGGIVFQVASPSTIHEASIKMACGNQSDGGSVASGYVCLASWA